MTSIQLHQLPWPRQKNSASTTVLDFPAEVWERILSYAIFKHAGPSHSLYVMRLQTHCLSFNQKTRKVALNMLRRRFIFVSARFRPCDSCRSLQQKTIQHLIRCYRDSSLLYQMRKKNYYNFAWLDIELSCSGQEVRSGSQLFQYQFIATRLDVLHLVVDVWRLTQACVETHVLNVGCWPASSRSSKRMSKIANVLLHPVLETGRVSTTVTLHDLSSEAPQTQQVPKRLAPTLAGRLLGFCTPYYERLRDLINHDYAAYEILCFLPGIEGDYIDWHRKQNVFHDDRSMAINAAVRTVFVCLNLAGVADYLLRTRNTTKLQQHWFFDLQSPDYQLEIPLCY